MFSHAWRRAHGIDIPFIKITLENYFNAPHSVNPSPHKYTIKTQIAALDGRHNVHDINVHMIADEKMYSLSSLYSLAAVRLSSHEKCVYASYNVSFEC